jgi:hypothetical protein
MQHIKQLHGEEKIYQSRGFAAIWIGYPWILFSTWHYADYFKGYPNFKGFKMALMEAVTLDSVISLLKEIETFYSETN